MRLLALLLVSLLCSLKFPPVHAANPPLNLGTLPVQQRKILKKVKYLDKTVVRTLKTHMDGLVLNTTTCVASFRRLLNLREKAVPPAFCLSNWDIGPNNTLVNIGEEVPEHYLLDINLDLIDSYYVFVRYEKDIHPFIICKRSKIGSLKLKVASKFNLDAQEVYFVGCQKSDSETLEGFVEMEEMPGEGETVTYRQSVNSKSLLIVSVQPKDSQKVKVMAPEKVTGLTILVDLPDGTTVEVDDVDKEKNVGWFRSRLQAHLTTKNQGLGMEKAVAICSMNSTRPDFSKEAKDSDKLEDVLGTAKHFKNTNIKVFDWILKLKDNEYPISVCPQSTFFEALKRGLRSFKSIGQGRVPEMFSTNPPQEIIDLTGIVPANPLSPYNVRLDGSLILEIEKTKVLLPEGLNTLAKDARELYGKEVKERQWLYEFCYPPNPPVNNTPFKQFKATELLSAHLNNVFIKKLPTEPNPVTAYVYQNGTTKEYPFRTCSDTSYNLIAPRIQSLLGLSANRSQLYFYTNTNGIWTQVVGATLDGHVDSNFLVSDKKIDQNIKLDLPVYASLFTDPGDAFFTMTLQLESGFPITVENVSVYTTIGKFRETLHEKIPQEQRNLNMHMSVALCATDGREMDDNRPFKWYGAPIAKALNSQRKLVTIGDYTGQALETYTVTVCEKSTYRQLLSRSLKSLESIDELSELRVIVEEGEKNKFVSRVGVSLDKVVSTDCQSDDVHALKEAKVIYVLNKNASFVDWRGKKRIPVGSPEKTKVGVIREWLIKNDTERAYDRALCAPYEWMHWRRVEMDENLSLAYYGYSRTGAWKMPYAPRTIKVHYDMDGASGNREMEICHYSSYQDIEHRILKALGANMSAEVSVGPRSFLPGILFHLFWLATNNSNFLSDLKVVIKSPSSAYNYQLDVKPTVTQKAMKVLTFKASDVGEKQKEGAKVEPFVIPIKFDLIGEDTIVFIPAGAESDAE